LNGKHLIPPFYLHQKRLRVPAASASRLCLRPSILHPASPATQAPTLPTPSVASLQMLWKPKICSQVLFELIPHPQPTARLLRQVPDLRLHLSARDVAASWLPHILSYSGPHNRHDSCLLRLCRWLRRHTAPLNHHSLPPNFGVRCCTHSVVYSGPRLARPLCSGSGLRWPHRDLSLALRRHHYGLDSGLAPAGMIHAFTGAVIPPGRVSNLLLDTDDAGDL
jgi:hypothetical protein